MIAADSPHPPRRRMTRLPALAWLAAWLCLLAMTPLAAREPAKPEAFARGMNIADYLAYPDGESWPLFIGPDAEVTDADLRQLAEIGFTFIRLPVEPGPFLDSGPAHVTALERRFVSILKGAHANGLAVMVTGFARHEMPPWRPEDILQGPGAPAFKRYAAFLARLAELTLEVPEATVALEPMNEPQPECEFMGSNDWSVMQRELYTRLRAASARLTLVLTTGCWASLRGLKHLDMKDYDANTLVDIHYYEPFSYTHQGATWTLPELKYTGGLSFPARDTDKARAREAISRLAVSYFPSDRREQRRAYAAAAGKLEAYMREDMDAVSISRDMVRIGEWADKAGVARNRIVIGEFGALKPHPKAGIEEDGSRARWLRAISGAAGHEGFGWAVWGYSSRFAIFDRHDPKPGDAANLKALGLEPPVPGKPEGRGSAGG